MKIKFSAYLLAVAVVLILGAFQLNYAQTIIGTWKLKNFSAGFPTALTGKARVAAKADMKNLSIRLKTTTFVFNKDGSLFFLKTKGKWAIDKNGTTAYFTNNNNQKSVINIVMLNAHEFVFTRVDDGVFQTFDLFK